MPAPSDPSQRQEEEARVSAWGFALGAGTQLVVCVLLGVGAGWYSDKRLGTSPWLLIFGIFAGIALGLYQLVKEAGKMASGSKRR